MHGESFLSGKPDTSTGDRRLWFLQLTRYHWFVLAVAALGWLFDCLDQQIFNLARKPAVRELLLKFEPEGREPPGFSNHVDEFGGYATSIFLIGWASGGLAFGVLGDRIGRAKTMLMTILIYSAFTGLSAFSYSVYDFALYRFLTGLGVGGEFAVGVALVAETMPDRARTGALGTLQALSAIGNVSAALISIGFGQLHGNGLISSSWQWRGMFLIGTLPAMLAVLIRTKLKEPERWAKQAHLAPTTAIPPTAFDGAAPSPPDTRPVLAQRLGSIQELFGDPRWRRNALVGVALASAGVIGLWGIGFFSFDLNRTVFRNVFRDEALQAGQGENDRVFVRHVFHELEVGKYESSPINPADLVDPEASRLYRAALKVHTEHPNAATVTADEVLDDLDRQGLSEHNRAECQAILTAAVPDEQAVEDAEQAVTQRTKTIGGKVTKWVGISSLTLNFGGCLGIYAFSVVAQWTGRRMAFAVSFLLAAVSTGLTFGFINRVSDVFWMIPIMGFCQLSLFGGYAIYFPELFPTRLRSTGTSFCYNVGRFLAAVGPSMLGLLTNRVFEHYHEPMRYAGVTMCSVFILGLLALPFAPETKDQPLPE